MCDNPAPLRALNRHTAKPCTFNLNCITLLACSLQILRIFRLNRLSTIETATLYSNKLLPLHLNVRIRNDCSCPFTSVRLQISWTESSRSLQNPWTVLNLIWRFDCTNCGVERYCDVKIAYCAIIQVQSFPTKRTWTIYLNLIVDCS